MTAEIQIMRRVIERRYSLRVDCAILADRRLSFRPKWRNLLLFRIVTRDYSFWVYIVTNRSHSVLYIGVTNSLSRRAWQHREGTGAAFPATYHCTNLIYDEQYWDVRAAIAREAQLKKWSRTKKVELINRLNPRCMDIGDRCLENSERCLHFGRHDKARGAPLQQRRKYSWTHAALSK